MSKILFSPEKHLGLSEQVVAKIIDRSGLPPGLSPETRTGKLVLCHGTFDLVHPGHLRHLAFARAQGDTLVVSITADEFVTKANLRPYVPEEMRALNLAALQIVDFVVIDRNPESASVIAAVQPDIFVKGFEYHQLDDERSVREEEAVAAVGGKMVFSPGDYVMSSSSVIETEPPRLALEKLLTLMQAEQVGFDDLRSSIKGLDSLRITVIGDTIVDGLIDGTVIGGFRKTPTPSVRVKGQYRFVGGAGIVAKHVAATGACVRFVSIVGDDENGDFAVTDLRNASIECKIHVDPSRPTTHKQVVLADDYRLVRLDSVDNRPISDRISSEMASEISESDSDAIIFSDFRHGIFHEKSIKKMMSAAPSSSLTVGDSQVASRWGNVMDFAGCDILTPNEEEVRFALGDQDTVVRPLGTKLQKLTKCKVLMVKLGDRGMMTFREPILKSKSPGFFAVDSLIRTKALDPVGAGDALLAYATLSYIQSQSSVVASIIGSVAAGLACEFEGNVPVDAAMVGERIDELESQAFGS